MGLVATTRRVEPWTPLLDAGRADERLVREAFEGARAPQLVDIPGDLHPAVLEGLEARRDRGAVLPPGRGAGVRVGRADDRHHGHGVGEVAVLQPADAGDAVLGRQGAGAVPLPDQGAVAGPGPGAQRLRPAQAGAARDLRRRHPARGAAGDPAPVEPDPHQPRHAPRRDPAQPPRLGRLLRQPGGGRRRRGARLPRGLRLARGQRAAAAAADRPRLRHRAALSHGQRDDRQPGRARRAPERAGVRPGRPRRRAGRAAPDRHVEPARGRRGAADAAQRAGRGRGPGRGARARGCADDLLHQVAQGGRAGRADRRATCCATTASATGWPPTGPATRRSSAASWRPGW